MAGPIGPPGFNGSQGPSGPIGANGPPGPQGSGNFSACQYKVETGTVTPGTTKATASKTETDVSKLYCTCFFRVNILYFCVYFSLFHMSVLQRTHGIRKNSFLKVFRAKSGTLSEKRYFYCTFRFHCIFDVAPVVYLSSVFLSVFWFAFSFVCWFLFVCLFVCLSICLSVFQRGGGGKGAYSG